MAAINSFGREDDFAALDEVGAAISTVMEAFDFTWKHLILGLSEGNHKRSERRIALLSSISFVAKFQFGSQCKRRYDAMSDDLLLLFRQHA